MSAYDPNVNRRSLKARELARNGFAANRMREQRMEELTAEDGRQQRPWQVSFMLRFILHFSFYGWVAWWLLGKPEIPIRWLQ